MKLKSIISFYNKEIINHLLELIDTNQKTQMYIIVQELLQNVNKNSKASNCFVFFLKHDNKLVIKLHDNGIGMDPEKIQKGLD